MTGAFERDRRKDRDKVAGRMVAGDGKARRWRSPLHGCPPRWAHLEKLELARIYLRVQRTASDLASIAGVEEEQRAVPSWAQAMIAVRSAEVAQRVRVLEELIFEANMARHPISQQDHEAVAAEIARRTGSPFARSTLSLSPYRELLRKPIEGDAAALRRAMRMTRSELFAAINCEQEKAKALRELIRAAIRASPVPKWGQPSADIVEWPIRANG